MSPSDPYGLPHASGLAALNNITTANAYGAANTTLNCEGSHRQTFLITGAAVFIRIWQRFSPGQRAGGPGVELFMPPGFYDRTWALDRIEVRSAVSGKPAQITIHAD